MGSLEEVHMPQNGINHPGVTALATAMQHNAGLRILNLNDNTFTEKGAIAMAQVQRHQTLLLAIKGRVSDSEMLLVKEIERNNVLFLAMFGQNNSTTNSIVLQQCHSSLLCIRCQILREHCGSFHKSSVVSE